MKQVTDEERRAIWLGLLRRMFERYKQEHPSGSEQQDPRATTDGGTETQPPEPGSP